MELFTARHVRVIECGTIDEDMKGRLNRGIRSRNASEIRGVRTARSIDPGTRKAGNSFGGLFATFAQQHGALIGPGTAERNLEKSFTQTVTAYLSTDRLKCFGDQL
jgi:hypothetical protein